MQHPARSAILVLALLAGCGGAPESAGGTTVVTTDVDGASLATVTLDGVEISIEPPVRYRYRSVRSTPPAATDEEPAATINGHPFGVRDGVFHIGDAAFGVVAAGDRVRVSGEGVLVGGARRGDVPAQR